MIIYPAIDLYEKKAVRLIKGDYAQMTIYSENPTLVAKEFKQAGAKAIHIVDLEGARDGTTPNYEVIKEIASDKELFIQVGGGIRTLETIEKYLNIGVKRVILGTAAVSEQNFLQKTVEKYKEAIAVSVDIKDDMVAIKGWTEVSNKDVFSFCDTVEKLGVQTIICTDISKDGMQSGSNLELYRILRDRLSINLIASGGVSTKEELKILSNIGMDGAIIGKAIYTGDIKLKEVV
ncbi:MAG: 1-(5-phosphoribosyl)-5-[(5-phosphoribosylamino)methylideneamino]imidazole-4-carboxamide isomerase [Oscillospiraceae bacterium]|jgi:phosphoribosylformimino-5-aminoimidazole carboxamide ribotide isomerase|nr:1-(5-phosphoribosyl)-5-[(5-phosphoribosylamino)methylideneamino]imidazole-4-carboxamide isomerase [Oscillospiraceae bacterium]